MLQKKIHKYTTNKNSPCLFLVSIKTKSSFQYCIRQGQILAEVKNIRQFYAIKSYLTKEHPDGLIRYQINQNGSSLNIRCYFIGARWYIGMPSASHAADPGSNPGDGELLSNK